MTITYAPTFPIDQLVTCSLCGAPISLPYTERHTNWHVQLQQKIERLAELKLAKVEVYDI
jgi:hypothetical protein